MKGIILLNNILILIFLLKVHAQIRERKTFQIYEEKWYEMKVFGEIFEKM